MSSHFREFLLLLYICAHFVGSEARQRCNQHNCINTISNNFNDSSRFLPAYAVANHANVLNSTTCQRDLNNFHRVVDQRILWALKVLEASGKPRAGFIHGNNFWLGSRSQCLNTMDSSLMKLAGREIASNTLYRDPRQEIPPFDVNYFVAHFRHNSILQYQVKLRDEDLITLGLCLPASCSTEELGLILQKIFRERILAFGDLYSADFQLEAIRDLRDDYQWLFHGAPLFIGSFLAFTWFLMITGTIYDVFVYRCRQSTYQPGKIVSSEKMPLKCDSCKSYVKFENAEVSTLFPVQAGRIGRILMHFAIYTNTKILFSMKSTADTISCIDGIRALSMLWVLIVHTPFFSLDYIENKPLLFKLCDCIVGQIFCNSTLVVDSFFCIGGFLLAHTYLSKHPIDEHTTGDINYNAKVHEFFNSVLKRLIRITPSYLMTIGLAYLTTSWYSRNSSLYMSERIHESCAKYWWRNLLYINNLFSHDTICMVWSWYLSNDMQFFVIGLLVLNLATVCYYVAAALLCGLLVGSIMFTGYVSYVNDFVPTLAQEFTKQDKLYYPPWIRIGPYLIGMIAAYVALRVNKGLNLKKKTVMFLWCLGVACNIFSLFITYKPMSGLTAAFYVALRRPLWAAGVAWILIACCTKHGGIVNQMLSWRGWLPFSRLAYCAYLINPIIISWFRLQSESSVYATITSEAVTIMGSCVACYVCAYILYLMSEASYMTLLKQLVEPKSIRK